MEYARHIRDLQQGQENFMLVLAYHTHLDMPSFLFAQISQLDDEQPMTSLDYTTPPSSSCRSSD
jgi:hypothetical protein